MPGIVPFTRHINYTFSISTYNVIMVESYANTHHNCISIMFLSPIISELFISISFDSTLSSVTIVRANFLSTNLVSEMPDHVVI